MGMDGSGKTTHARRVLGLIEKRCRAKYVWFGSAYFLSYPFMAFCRLIGLTVMRPLGNGRTYVEHQYYRNTPVAFIWPWVQLTDVLLFSTFKISVPIRRGYALVLDRYVHDILVHLMVDTNRPTLHRTLAGRLMLAIVPSRLTAILLDPGGKVAMQRKMDFPTLAEATMRGRYYRILARDLKIVRVDSSREFRIVHREILREVGERASSLAEARIRTQLRRRLQARARWKKMKKGPIALLRQAVRRRMYVPAAQSAIADVMSEHDAGSEPFGRDVKARFHLYLELLKRRRLRVHTVILLGSRSKGRWKPDSDFDILVIASGLPAGILGDWLRQYILSDIPLFLGVEPYGSTEKEFLEMLVNLDLIALDAICWGQVLFDDGFWSVARQTYERVRASYGLDTGKLSSMLLPI
jgi:hypothetical protein